MHWRFKFKGSSLILIPQSLLDFKILQIIFYSNVEPFSIDISPNAFHLHGQKAIGWRIGKKNTGFNFWSHKQIT